MCYWGRKWTADVIVFVIHLKFFVLISYYHGFFWCIVCNSDVSGMAACISNSYGSKCIIIFGVVNYCSNVVVLNVVVIIFFPYWLYLCVCIYLWCCHCLCFIIRIILYVWIYVFNAWVTLVSASLFRRSVASVVGAEDTDFASRWSSPADLQRSEFSHDWHRMVEGTGLRIASCHRQRECAGNRVSDRQWRRSLQVSGYWQQTGSSGRCTCRSDSARSDPVVFSFHPEFS